MPAYDASRSPPAPVAEAVLRSPSRGAARSGVLMLIDSGADVTLLPRGPVAELGVTPLPDTRYELAGFDGSRSLAEVVEMEMVFLGRVFRGRYLLGGEREGVLGRDVLNHLRLVLDGPRAEWSEATDR